MSLDTLIKKAVAKNPSIAPVKLKRRNAQPEAIEQAKQTAEEQHGNRISEFAVFTIEEGK